MAVKLWTAHFTRICVANLLLFAAFYMLLPILSVEVAGRCGIPLPQAGYLFLSLVAGMFLVGPFHAYLMDAYKRKYVYMLSFAIMLLSAVGYMFVTGWKELLLLSVVQGGAFGMAATAGITLAIDLTNSSLRSAGNRAFAWMSHFGMIIGVILGMWIRQQYAFDRLLLASVIIGGLGILIASGVYVPFRAPIVTKIVSFDRFLLFRGWVPSVCLLLITFAAGLLISSAHPLSSVVLNIGRGIALPVSVGVGIGFLVALLIARSKWAQEKTILLIEVGMVLNIVAFFLLGTEVSLWFSSVLLGIGFGFTVPELLTVFVKLSHHCQRGTANTTYLLLVETGICLGIAAANAVEPAGIFRIGQLLSAFTLLFFLFVTLPYYKRKRVR